MARLSLYRQCPKYVRDTLNQAIEVAGSVHQSEAELVRHLRVIDRERLFVRYGYKSLLGFCTHCLKFTRIQSQRIVTHVRRNGPADKS